MTQPQNSGRKDKVWIIFGWLVLLALMTYPIIFLASALAEIVRGVEPWAMLGVILVVPGFLLSVFIGIIAALVGISLRLPRLPLKWFLLGFDIPGLVYAATLVYFIFLFRTESSPGFVGFIVAGSLASGAAGLVLMVVLILLKCRILAQKPPSGQ